LTFQDLNRVKNKPLVPAVEDQGRPDHVDLIFFSIFLVQKKRDLLDCCWRILARIFETKWFDYSSTIHRSI